MLGLHVQTFFLPKQGHQLQDYEDAWAYDMAETRLALADGASDGFESRLWARALVQAFIREPPAPTSESLQDWLAAPMQVWKEGIDWGQLPWYAEEKARRGAFATLLGLTFVWPSIDSSQETETEAQWKGIAVGDACLFQIRGDKMVMHFPMEKSTDFGTIPPLLSTRLDYNRRSLQVLQTRKGICWPGDLFVLATDALAAWFLHQVEAGEHPWEPMVDLTADTFAALVTRLRHEGTMRNDDVTLILGCVKNEADLRISPSQEES